MNEDYFFLNNSFENNEINSFLLMDKSSLYKGNIDLNDSNKSEDNINNSFSQISPVPFLDSSKENEENKQKLNSNNNKNNSSSLTKDKSSQNKILNNNNQFEFLAKKKRPRIHLEDLDIPEEMIKDKKYQRIGDKVILSKNKVITDDDKKEIRAMRNRICAQKNRDRKKQEFIDLKENVRKLTDELNKKILLINNFERVCCAECKLKMEEINQKIIKKDEEDNLILEENESSETNKNNFIFGKIPGFVITIISLLGILLCICQGSIFWKNKSMNQKIVLTNSYQGTLRHLNNDDICPTRYDNNNSNIYNETNNNISYKGNMPLSIENFNNNNLLQFCHDKFTWEIYTKLKRERELLGNLMKKRYNKDSILNNLVCLENDTSNVNPNNTLPIEAKNVRLNNYLSSKVISVFIKDYEALRKCVNGRILPLQEQIEREAKTSDDGCVFIQMIIPKEVIKSNYDKNGTSFSEFENDYFEIRCKIFAYNNYYEKE